MLLETLDIKKDDVIIYSQNLFDLEKNFMIIYKDDPKKEAHKISFEEVCRFVNEFTPKNLIVYRLMINIRDFEIYLSKYGFFININEVTELIYFDPIFAIKELEDYAKAANSFDIRFRIQQVGLTALNRMGNVPNYAEIYSVDLESMEAKFQNDKIFADAIFAFSTDGETAAPDKKEIEIPALNEKKITKHEEKKTSEPKIQRMTRLETVNQDALQKPAKRLVEEIKKIQKIEKQTKIPEEPEKILEIQPPVKVEPELPEVNPIPRIMIDEQHEKGIKIIKHDISEDKNFDYKQILRMNFSQKALKEKENNSTGLSNKQEIKSEKDRPQPFPKSKSEFGKFLQKNQNEKIKGTQPADGDEDKRKTQPVNIFKSSASLNKFLKERENKQVVLRLNKK